MEARMRVGSLEVNRKLTDVEFPEHTPMSTCIGTKNYQPFQIEKARTKLKTPFSNFEIPLLELVWTSSSIGGCPSNKRCFFHTSN